MVRIRKFGAGFVLAAVAFLAGCNGDGNGVLRYPSEGDFVVTIGPTAEGSLFTDKRTADAYQTVTIWIKPGKVPVVTRDDKEGTQLLTNGGISPDPSLKSKLGIEVGQIYTFVMPESDVTITIPGEIPEDPDVFIKNITMQSVPLYTADEPDIFINDGAPGPSIRNVSVVTQNSNGKIKIKIDRGAQKVISYQIGNNGDKIDLEDAADFEIDSPPLDGSLSLKVFASDGATERVYPYMIYNYDPPPNNDALLYSLTISDVTFNFNSTQFNYDLTSSPVDNSVNQVTVTAVTNHTAAAITLNGAPSASGTGVQFNLAKTGLTPDKANVVTLTVTPETGAADAKTYTIKIYRKLSANADLASLVVSGATVSPAFSANTTAYSNSTAKVSYSTALAALKASPANANATMALQVGEDQAFPMFMGIDYDVALLNYGNDVNTAKVIVSAEDGVTTKTYTVTLHRNAPAVVSENAKLTGISVKTVSGADVALSPAFAASTYLYSNPVKLAASDDQVVVSATAASGCTITVNSASVNIDGTGGKTVDLLNSGNNANTIALLVTSADGGEQTYFVKLYRERSSDASLKALSVTNPSIIFTFSPDQLVYDLNGDTQKIESSINTAMITATAARVTSKIKTNYTTVISGVGSLVPLTGTINAPDEIAVDVTAEDGTEKHYKVRIYRKLSSDARLADLSVTGGGLSLSGFTLLSASSTENPAYNLNTNNTPVPFSVNAIAVRPVVNHSGASIKIGIVTVTSGLNYNWNFTGNGGSVVKMSLAIVVTAQDGVTKKTYTINVWRREKLSDNTNITSITAAIVGNKDTYARVSPAANKDVIEYTIYVSDMTKPISIGVTLEDSEASYTVSPNNTAPTVTGSIEDWKVMTLKPPYVITVLAPDLTTSKKYNISMLVRTPASLGKVPMAKGGTITMVGADEVHEFYNSKQGEALDSALEFIRDLPDDSWILLQGGGGQGGKKHEFAGIDYSGGGGGGAGAVIEHKSWSWKNSDEGNNKKIYEVHVGAASAVDPDGSNGSTYLAKRGGNSWFGYRTGNENRWRGLRAPGGGPGLNGEVTQSTSYSFRNSSNDNILTKNDSTPDQAGTITDYFNYNNIGGAQGAGAGAIYSWLFKPGSSYLFSDFLGDDLEYAGAPHIYHKCLQTYKDSDGNSLFTISDLSTTGGSGGWFAIGFETTFGGYGGGGAGGNGSAAERGYVGIMDGGGGGPGIKSSITGTEKEYGKGGKGGRSYSSGGDHGQGGNNENNSESDADSDNYRLGGNGRVIVRFAWKPF